MTKVVRRSGGRSIGNQSFEFIDLFAGIGGIRQAFERHGGRCVFTSEWDKFAQVTYKANFPKDHHDLVGDIRQVSRRDIPEHDVLLAGFPCQPFSLAGVSKKNSLGRAHGFDDPTQGTLFHEIKSILEHHEPSAFMLENVKHLLRHDGGRTFEVVHSTLVDLGYDVHFRVIDGARFVPQHRERIIIVGFKHQTDFTWDDLNLPAASKRMDAVLHRTDGREPRVRIDGDRFFNHELNEVQSKYTLSERLWEYLQGYAEKHRKAGNGFGYGLVGRDSLSRTLSARYHKDGSEILVEQETSVPRRLTPRECARLMGFPDSFIIPVSDTQAYRQFGNSVVVPAVAEVARIMVPHLTSQASALKKGA
jgi:DNA (cytosine-5)-methyltransferase 1